MTRHTYRTVDAPVRGGTIRAGVWEPADPAAPTLIALHGVTANHLAFRALAEALPEVRIIAPDLRGRGRSNALPAPFGMPQHAQDVADLAGHLQVERAVVLGHSMGGFVAVVLAHRHPELVERLVLADGGLPLALPPGVDADTAMGAVLGPAAERLSMTFVDHESYRDYWKQHPAFADTWGPDVAAYVDYDLEPVDGGYRPSTRVEALAEDQRELFDGASLLPALDGLRVPTALLRAPYGLLAGEALYPAGHVEEWAARTSGIQVVHVPDVNHYTIVMAPAGAAAVADQVRRGLTADTQSTVGTPSTGE